MRKARGLRRRHDDGGGHQHPEELLRALRVGKPSRAGSRRSDQQRRVRAEQQQRGEIDDERQRHRAPVGRRLWNRQRRRQNRGEDQAAELERPVRLRPASESKKQPRADRNRREREHA